MRLKPVCGHSKSACALLCPVDFLGHNFILKCSFLLGVGFDDPLNSRQKHPWSFEMEAVVVSQKFNFVIELRCSVVSFQGFL